MTSIMIQGTGSHVGKSVLVTALCRIFVQDGFNVSPFKSQNMALNSYITKDGGEMGRSQAVQAQAAMKEPSVHMNPVLLKPKEDCIAQVIVLGKAINDMNVIKYRLYKNKLIKVITDSYNKLKNESDVIIIEGAGSPAEINLRDEDIVNMKMAEIADCPVILVVDIDKGGALAWVVGTLDLLTKEEKDRIKGIIINKFRGDIKILEPGLKFLEKKTGKPILGVIPFFRDIYIEEEDTVSEYHANTTNDISIGVVHLPHISNFTDFDPLEQESEVSVKYIKRVENLNDLDVLIIPGTKNTISDLLYLKKSGLFDGIKKLKIPVIGICGGFQILGKKLFDSEKIESRYGSINGLNLLDIESTFESMKLTQQVRGKILDGFSRGNEVEGYEIHMGKTRLTGEKPFIALSTNKFDGAISKDGRVWGTYFHGIFENDNFRKIFINHLRKNKGLAESDNNFNFRVTREENFDKLADLVRNNLDMKSIRRILNV